MKKISFLSRTSILLAFFLALDKALAFVRSVLIARQFRLSIELDAFNAANNLPDLLFAMISGGALAMAFIPILSETIALRGRHAAWDLFSRLANIGFLTTAAAAVVVAIFAEEIVRSEVGIVPGFSPENQKLVAELMRLNLIATIIFSISGLVMAGLQANQHFLLPAMAPSLYNLGMIFGAVVLSPTEPYRLGMLTIPAFGLGIHGLVYGVILGAALHLAIQIPGLIKYHFHWTPSLNVRDERLLAVLKLIGPRLLTMFGIQSIFIIRDNLASRLDQPGAVSALTYGWMIMQVPETIFGTAIAIALLPTLSEYAARQDWSSFRQTIEKAIRVLLVLTLPAAAILAASLRPLIAVAFGFNAADTSLLTWTTTMYLAALTGYTVHEVLVRSFYARKEAWVPVLSILIRLSVFLAIGVTAIDSFRDFGTPLIALAEISLTAEAIVLFLWLNSRLPERIRVGSALLRGLVAALASGVISYLLSSYLPGPPYLASLAGLAGGGGLAFLIIWKDLRLLFKL
jgi:putative peptidoglycan lipid II flippase